MSNQEVNFHINKVEFMVFLTRISHDIYKYAPDTKELTLPQKIEKVIEKLIQY